MIGKNEILTFLKERKSEFFLDFQLVKLGLGGSFARDEAHEGSDIDLIIEFEPNTDDLSEKKFRLKALLEKQFSRDVDLCREKYLKPYFKSQILQSAIYV